MKEEFFQGKECFCERFPPWWMADNGSPFFVLVESSDNLMRLSVEAILQPLRGTQTNCRETNLEFCHYRPQKKAHYGVLSEIINH